PSTAKKKGKGLNLDVIFLTLLMC
ncbi:hypothetical protein L350_07508, partial [Enterobacter sp. MGH 4]